MRSLLGVDLYPEKKPQKKRHKKPVSAKSSRSAGRSRDTFAGVYNTRDYAVQEAPKQCDALDPVTGTVYFRKKYKHPKPGQPLYYNGRVVKGERCTNLAIISYSEAGKTVHRCAKHLRYNN